jgi:hypothetical protein
MRSLGPADAGPSLQPGDAVVMDNLGSHEVASVAQAHLADFTKLKTLLGKGAARIQEALWNTLGQLLDRFFPGECRLCVRHCRSGWSE